MKMLNVDMDNVLVFLLSGIDRLSPEIISTCKGRLDEVPVIFLLMHPMQDAIKSYNALSQKYDTCILSTSP